MRVLITGVAGFTGSRLAEWILAHVPDCEVWGVDDLSCGYPENVPAGVEWTCLQLGVGDPKVAMLFSERVDYVFHLAAYAAEGLSPFIRRYNYQNNLAATAELITAAIEAGNVRRFVFTSSMAVYGEGSPPFNEDDPCRPIDPYGVAKAACERDLWIAGQQHGLDWSIIRPHNLYGPGQSIWQKYRNVLGLWMQAYLAGEPLLVYGDGRQQRAFSYIDDCLPCLWEAATSPWASREIINLGGMAPTSIRAAAELVREVIGGGTIRHVEPRHEVARAWCTYRKSVDYLGYGERTPLREGLAAMWERARREWELYPERRTSSDGIQIELRRGLYPFWQ